MSVAGVKDKQSVLPGGRRVGSPNIQGVQIFELGNVLTRSGSVLEVFRTDWEVVKIQPRHVIWVQMNPGAVTDWHRHLRQTDHLVAVTGSIKVGLWDGRPDSPSSGKADVIRFGALQPALVIVPPGVWHGLRNESGQPAGYLNVNDQPYDHADPDNFRLPAGGAHVGVEL
jgi:dTDP-4-dehydrorhamnose 3,5-epimerase